MKRLAAVLVSVLALAGCATTGQPGDPGVAAHWNGTVITNAEVGDWSAGAAELGLIPDAGAGLTLLMLRPTIDRFAAEGGVAVTDAEVSADAASLLATLGRADDEVTPEMIQVVRTARLFDAVLEIEGFVDAAIEDWNSIDNTAVISPLYGEFSINVLGDTLDRAHSLATSGSSGLGDLSYLEYTSVSAFDTDAPAAWTVGEPPAAAPSAAPAG